MHRSSSLTIVPDDYYRKRHPSPPPPSSPSRTLSLDAATQLPHFDSFAESQKKEKARYKLAENAVHLIPLVLLLCGFILWFVSNPEMVDVTMKSELIAARVQGLSLDGVDNNTETMALAGIDLGDLDPGKEEDGDQKDSASNN